MAAEPEKGRAAAIDRAAQLAAVLKGLGYKGIHIGGVHRRFDWAGRLLDRMAGYESQWQDIASRISFPAPGRFRAFPAGADFPAFGHGLQALSLMEKLRFHFLRRSHDLLFNRGNLLGPLFHKLCALADGTWIEKFVLEAVEEPVKRFLLNCQRCGDCGIQHVGFLCPESGCPKHMRNGACGGSNGGKCEVYADRDCIWVRAYSRLAHAGRSNAMIRGCVPPRMWELNQSSSWFNFHLGRDHQSASSEIARRCRLDRCKIKAGEGTG